MSTTKIKKKEFTKKRKTNKYIIKKRKTNKYIIKKRITKYKNQYTTKQSHKNKKRKNMKKYAYNMKGGDVSKHVFIRPYYPDEKNLIERIENKNINLYYYGDFEEVNVKIVEEIKKNIQLLENDTIDHTDILNTYTKENIENFTKAFSSSNSRPEFNKVRNLYRNATGTLTSKQVLEYFKAIARDIEVLAESKKLFANSILLKAPPRDNRCSISISQQERIDVGQWIFRINKDKIYYLDHYFTEIFDLIFARYKAKSLRFSNGIYTTYGSDLWFVYVKFIQELFDSSIKTIAIIPDGDAARQDNYLKCIEHAFDLMSTKNIVKREESLEYNIYLYNDSLDNDIDDILAIICLEYLYQQKNITGSLNYKEGQQFRWVDNTHTEYEKTKVILSKLHTKIKEIIAKKEPLFSDDMEYRANYN